MVGLTAAWKVALLEHTMVDQLAVMWVVWWVEPMGEMMAARMVVPKVAS